MLEAINDTEFTTFRRNAELEYALLTIQEDFQNIVRQEVAKDYQLLRELNLRGAS